MPHAHASTPDQTDPRTLDHERVIELAVEIERHRHLLRHAAEDYRRRVRQRFEHLDPPDRDLRLRQAEQFLDALMIDPIRHGRLDLDAYRAIRDRAPVVFDSERGVYVLRRTGQHPLLIHPGRAEQRLGVIARLAALGLRVEEIQVVALTTAQMAAPQEAATPPTTVPEVQRGTTKPSRGVDPTGGDQ
ncbi:hypothetical protein AB0B25_18990 [Nocardia sp. NPDC049190]|uniref:hypothetical protein n=1 Tax=Nocardia sp. NPDC049190 TaxID=3155650 RepID=UPI0033C04F11